MSLFKSSSKLCLALAFSNSARSAVMPRTVSGTDASTFNLYGYGAGISGLPLFYADGLAYIGYPESVDTFTNITNVTFTQTSPLSPFLASPTTGSQNLSSSIAPLSLYLVPSSGSYQAVGFTSNTTSSSSNSTAALPDGATTVGLLFLGTQVIFQNTAEDFQAKFWADGAVVAGAYVVKWNSDGAVADGSVPVVLKSTGPPKLAKET